MASLQSFLPTHLYTEPAVHLWDCDGYASAYWHPLTATASLQPNHSMALTLLNKPLLLTRPGEGPPRAFLNRCPHRGVAFQAEQHESISCRRLICPYHGWTYNLEGDLMAAARERDFNSPFQRQDWPLTSLPCVVDGPLIWVALHETVTPLNKQLELVHREIGSLWKQPLMEVRRVQQTLNCNWKIAHDNTLDDYHVAVAHPTTLHREQGAVRDYVHRFSALGTLLVTPHANGGSFHTFGLPPWMHLISWPEGRIALLEFLPRSPDTCLMQLRLFSTEHDNDAAALDAWLETLLVFLDEDRQLVESAQQGYRSGMVPGPPHELERRILHWQEIYKNTLPKDLWQ